MKFKLTFIGLFLSIFTMMSAKPLILTQEAVRQASDKETVICSMVTEKKVGRMIAFRIETKDGQDAGLKVDLGDGVFIKPSGRYPSYTVKGKKFRISASRPELVEGLILNTCNFSSIIVSSLTSLKKVLVGQNLLKGESMQEFVASLPATQGGALYLRNTGSSSDTQTMTKKQVESLRKRGWEVYTYRGSFANKTVYDGEEETTSVDEDVPAIEIDLAESAVSLVSNVEGKGDLFYKIGNGKKQALTDRFIYNVAGKHITIYGDITKLVCFQSSITKLIVRNAPNLTYLNCCANEISEENMLLLLKSLPSNGNLEKKAIIIDKKNSYSEKNQVPFQATEIAIAKNWKLFDWNNSQPIQIEQYIPAIIFNTMKQKGDLITLGFKGKNIRLDMGNGKIVTPKIEEMVENTYELEGKTVRIYGDIEKVSMPNNLITALDVSGAKQLNSLDVFQNALSEEAFFNLIKGLPYNEKSCGQLFVFDESASWDKNVFSKTCVKKANEKGWKVLYRTKGDKLAFYEGVVVEPKEVLAMSFETDLKKGDKLRIYAEGTTLVWLDLGDGTLQEMRPAGFNTVTIRGQKLKVYGNLTWLALGKSKLTKCEISEGLEFLQTLYLYDNNLSQLSLPYLKSLMNLNIAGNSFSKEESQRIVEALPNDKERERRGNDTPICFVVDKSLAKEQNKIAKETCEKGTNKGWLMMDFAGGEKDKQKEYAGDTIVALKTPELSGVKIYDQSHQIIIVQDLSERIVLYTMSGDFVMDLYAFDRNSFYINKQSLPKGAYILQIGKGKAFSIQIQ